MTKYSEPAFPIDQQAYDRVNNSYYDNLGLTKLEYFISHAPEEIPAWFKHKSDSKPSEPTLRDYENTIGYIRIENEQDSCMVHQWRSWADRGPMEDLPKHLKWYQDCWEKYWSDVEKYLQDDKKNRYFQWRLYYANTLLEELNK